MTVQTQEERGAVGGRFPWQPEHEDELQEAFGALIEDTGKLVFPKKKENKEEGIAGKESARLQFEP